MTHIFAALILCCASFVLALHPATAATINTVPVGNPGNVVDQNYGGQGQFGAVANAYRIGTYEVTNSQYAEFLNAKAASDPLSLYNSNMASDPQGGIVQTLSGGNYTYAVKTDMGNKPVNNVSWYDAIRFTNWLHNGQGIGDTETGAYTLSGGTPTPSNGDSITRNSGATWFLPSENEWYKAAYYDPRTAAEGGPAGDDNYWLYPTNSDSAPTIATADSVGDINNAGPNVANYLSGADWNGQDGNLTTVGSAGPLSASFYGTSDQGGNVWEWNEELFESSARGLRGASWDGDSFASNLAASNRNSTAATLESIDLGFRVAMIPEPSTGVLGMLALAGVCAWGWRRKAPSLIPNRVPIR